MHSIVKSRRGLATAAAVATTAALLSMIPLGAGTAVAAEAAEPPAELVIPAEYTADPAAGNLPVAGVAGFLQGAYEGGYAWVSYADGSRTELPWTYYTPFATGSDTIAEVMGQRVDLRDPHTGSARRITIPSGQQFKAMLGESVVTVETGNVRRWHLLTLDQGTVTDRTLTLPDGATDIGFGNLKTPYVLLLGYTLDGVRHFVRADSSFVPRPVDFGGPTTSNGSRIGGKHLFRFAVEGRVQLWDLTGDFSAPAHEMAWAGGVPVALVKDHVVTRVPAADGGERLVARPLSGGADLPLLDKLVGDATATPDGRVIAARAGSDTERTVHSVQAGPEGAAPVVTQVAEIPRIRTNVVTTNTAQGVLQVYGVEGRRSPLLRSAELSTSGGLTAGPWKRLGDKGTCWPGPCASMVPTGDGRYVSDDGPNGSVRVLEPGQSLPGTPVLGLSARQGALQASGRYAVYPTVAGETEVLDLDAKQVVLKRPRAEGQLVSIVGDTLWEESAANGGVVAVDVRSGAVRRSVQVADCDLRQLQVWGSLLYWQCDTKAGVRNLTTGADVAVPAHQSAFLADGYLAHQRDGVLSVTPLRGDGATREIGRPTRNGTDWSADRFGGHVSYLDDQERVHVVPTGVPASDVSVLDSDAAQVLDLAVADASWTGRWWLSKPAASWTLTVKDRAGAVVRTLRGGEARGLVKAAWDGRNEAGAVLADGGYRWELTAVPADGAGPELRQGGEVFLTHAGLGTYEPVTPTRVLDTRSGLGAAKAKVGPGGTVTLQVAGRGGVAAAGVSAVVLNVTAVNPTQSTFVSVYPYGTQRSTASNLNAAAGRTVPNLVTVPVRDGKVTLYNRAGTVDLVADVAGYYTLSGRGDRFEPVAPARVLDTRAGIGAPKAKVGAARTVSVQVAGRGGVPATDVSAVVLNVTATNPTASSFVSVYPYGTQRTAASNLNVVAGQTVANLVVVPVRDGKVTLYNHAGSIDLLADVAGYFTTSGQGDPFQPLPPQRVMDTRDNWMARKLGPGESAVLEIAGIGGVPASGASAVVLNVTATNATAPSTYIAVHPTLTNRPSNSNLNLGAGQTVANQVVVPVVNGRITFYNHAGSTDVIVDVFGYYTN
ncbi:FlgD immunoglobulin-like domain containing protein [Streptomyces sp. NPDC127114]|uniref:FlgD immunoglobulin-like domain containing protein n=1 Tax=Streptomyces sp. NPDC127114 TaxID=3345366 RepID=UPI003641AA69